MTFSGTKSLAAMAGGWTIGFMETVGVFMAIGVSIGPDATYEA